MEMVQTKIIAALCLAAATLSCTRQGQGETFSFEWQKFVMDGHRTGVTAPRNGHISETLGEIRDGKYISPNGTEFTGSVMEVAGIVLDAQEAMSELRTVVGHSENGMALGEPESALSDWVADAFLEISENCLGEKADVSLANFGGVRKNIPQGEIILDDVISMFPFQNHLCVVTLKGHDLWKIFDGMAAHKIQIFGGMRLEYVNGHLAKAEVGGKKLNPDKEYKLVTIDFLLDGGDNVNAAENAVSVNRSEMLVKDAMIRYIKELEASGKSVDYNTDGRIVIK